MLDDGTPEGAISRAMRPGSWDWNVRQDLLQGDIRLAEIFGLNPEHVREGMPLKDVLAIVHPEDRGELYASLARSLEYCVEYEATYRLRIDNDLRWVHAVGRCYEAKNVKRHVGIALDITGLRTPNEREALRLDRMAQHCLAAYRLARGSDRFNVRESIGKTLRTIAEELARSTSRR